MLTRGGEGVKNPENLADVIYERPLKRHQVQELVSDDVNDLAIERRPAGGAGVLASLVALVAQDVARGALQNQVNQFFANKNNKGNPLQT